jgi:lysophospholipase
MHLSLWGALVGTLVFAGSARAISEKDYAVNYLNTVVPFMRTGEMFSFSARDGMNLSGVRYVHPHAKGAIVILPGRSEPWLKYGEVFYDLYQRGYSLYSYDHRGQGLSPHLVAANPEIGDIDDFANYTRDFEDFLNEVVMPANDPKLFLLAHSMGGAIAANYLARGKTPFQAAVLSSPMLTINTAPYGTALAKAITWLAMGAGRGDAYALGKGDFDPNLPFEKNDVTGSPERFWMSNAVFQMNPAATIGGPSNEWVYHSLVATPKIVRKMKFITTPVLLFQAGSDQVVKPKGEAVGCASTPACTLVRVPGAQHEILMEKDAIRDPALAAIENFFR